MRSSGRAGSAPWDIQPIESTGRSWRSGFKNDPRLTWRRLGRPAQNDSRSHGRSVWLARLWPVAFLSRLASRSSKRTILAPRTVTPVVSFILYSITYPRISDPRIPHYKPESGHAITRTRSESQLSGPYRAHSYASHSLYCFGSQLTSHLVPRVLTQETIIFLTPPGQHRDTVAQACIVRHPLNLLYHPSFLTNTSHYIVLLQSRDGRGFRY